MDWHQPWLLMLPPEELEELHGECRERSKAHARGQRFGLAKAWQGLAHEVLERMLECEQAHPALDRIMGQMMLDDECFHRGAYTDGDGRDFGAGT